MAAPGNRLIYFLLVKLMHQ